MIEGYFALWLPAKPDAEQGAQRAATSAWIAANTADLLQVGLAGTATGTAVGYQVLAPLALPPTETTATPALLPLWVVDATGATKPLAGVVAAQETWQERAIRASLANQQDIQNNVAWQAAKSASGLASKSAKAAADAEQRSTKTGLLGVLSGDFMAIALLLGAAWIARQ